jgi:putative PIN family toxin of toxin-antitoxin system
VRAVFDPNVLIAALVSPRGSPGLLAARWRAGHFELVVSELVLGEVERALGYPKLSKRVSRDEAAGLVALLRANARTEVDPPTPPRRSRDAADDYLIALAEAADAVLVSGDRDLLDLGDELPILSPRQFLALLD